MQEAFALKTSDPNFRSAEEDIIKAIENDYDEEDVNEDSIQV